MDYPQNIRFEIIPPENITAIERIAQWYLSEWNIASEVSMEKLRQLPSGDHQFQVVMFVDGEPIATGGIYNHVGILDKVPHLNAFKHWLALVYTVPQSRQQGYGALLCKYMEQHALKLGLKELYLFTHTAESLYRRLNWEQTERIAAGGKDIVVMRKKL